MRVVIWMGLGNNGGAINQLLASFESSRSTSFLAHYRIASLNTPQQGE